MTPIDLLNRRLGEALGLIGGTHPRFCWKRSTELFWYFRENSTENFQRQCWADRIGPCWLLCQWMVPSGFDVSTGTKYPLTEENWFRMFRGQLPFPSRGEYTAHAETKLAPGQEPTTEMNQNYIWALDRQMSTSIREQLGDLQQDLDQHHAKYRENQYDEMMEEAPAFGNYAPGTRGGFLSFGGIG